MDGPVFSECFDNANDAKFQRCRPIFFALPPTFRFAHQSVIQRAKLTRFGCQRVLLWNKIPFWWNVVIFSRHMYVLAVADHFTVFSGNGFLSGIACHPRHQFPDLCFAICTRVNKEISAFLFLFDFAGYRVWVLCALESGLCSKLQRGNIHRDSEVSPAAPFTALIFCKFGLCANESLATSQQKSAARRKS